MKQTSLLLSETYRKFRRNLAVPAGTALHWMREREKLAARIKETGFEWKEDRYCHRFACWKEDGFDLRARIVDDSDGWWEHGTDTIGKFISRWQSGAIRHHGAGRNECQWFLPANPECGREDYRRACSYGRDWWYVGVEVTASRSGVELGEASLWGIEYEISGDDGYLTETALDLASEARLEAASKLQELCGCH